MKQLLSDAGITPTDEDLNTTVDLLEALGEQMSKALPKLIENIEPHYIQPTRHEQI